MNDMSSAMTQSVGEVDAGRSSIHKAGEEINQVVENINNVTRLMSSTASSVTQQSAAIEEIARSIDVIREKTSRSLENAERSLDISTKSANVIDERLGDYQKLDIPDSIFDYAKSDHITWKKKLAAMLVGKSSLSADELADHHHCRLGKWYYSITDKKMKDCEFYKALEEPHGSVHEHGKKSAELFAKGDRVGALEEYDAMAIASKKVIENLEAMKKKCLSEK
jgi:methyl-accepting chemotaxis protein